MYDWWDLQYHVAFNVNLTRVGISDSVLRNTPNTPTLAFRYEPTPLLEAETT